MCMAPSLCVARNELLQSLKPLTHPSRQTDRQIAPSHCISEDSDSPPSPNTHFYCTLSFHRGRETKGQILCVKGKEKREGWQTHSAQLFDRRDRPIHVSSAGKIKWRERQYSKRENLTLGSYHQKKKGKKVHYQKKKIWCFSFLLRCRPESCLCADILMSMIKKKYNIIVQLKVIGLQKVKSEDVKKYFMMRINKIEISKSQNL